MDFNDVKRRLEMTLSSLDARFDDSLEGNIRISSSEKSLGGPIIQRTVRVDFGSGNIDEILNKVFTILNNLASLKDILKKALVNKGICDSLAEDEIDKSLHLQVLIDLVNQFKHGTPLDRPRSSKGPSLKKVRQSLVLKTTDITNPATFTFNPENGAIESNGASIVINAEVHDDQGNMLFSLDELVQTSYLLFEKIAKDNGCI